MKCSFISSLIYFLFSFYIVMALILILLELSRLEIWVLIELISFTFIGLSLLSFIHYGTVSQGLISYFLIQSGFSILLLIFLLNFSLYSDLFLFGVYLALIAKMGVLPLGFWIYPVFSRLNGIVLYNSMTIQKLPLFIFISFLGLYSSLLYLILLINLAWSGVLALSSIDATSLLILRSIANNSWFWLRLAPLNFYIFITFYLVYMVGLYFALFSSSKSVSSISLLRLSGLPPFPIFFVKLAIILSIISISFSLQIRLFLFLFTISTFFISSSYIRIISFTSIYDFKLLSYVS